MPHQDVCDQSASVIAQGIRSRALRALDVGTSFLKRIDEGQAALNSHVHWDKVSVQNSMEEQITALEASLAAEDPLPLAGVPIAIKDNIMVAGDIVSCASRMLAQHRAAYDATVIKKLKSAGAILIGRTNMDEFGMGSSNENSAFGPVLNPHDKKHVAGGSSGGSAAALAANLVPLALGSDTGGSVRQPASFCGVCGLKPSYGRVSRYGLVAYASSLDQIGPMARNISDLALLYDVISGPDDKDSTVIASPAPPAFPRLRSGDLKGKRLAVIQEFMGEGISREVRARFEAALDQLRLQGAEIVEVSIPLLNASLPVYYIIATAEASSNLARYDGVRYGYRSPQPGLNLKDMYLASRSEGFGREVKQRIMLGTYVLSSGYYDAYYEKAARLREAMRREVRAVFEQKRIDALLSPTAPTTAFEIGHKTHDSLTMYLSDVYTLAANLVGIPALSQPMGTDSRGLPIGLQWMGPHQSEVELLQMAYQFESGLGSHGS